MAEKSRRKLLKGLGISIPTVWAAPIIEAVLLPAHAQTSQIFGLTCRANTNNGSFPFNQAPCSDGSQYGHSTAIDLVDVEALVDPTNDGGTVRLVATGTISGQILNTTAIVSGGIADFGDISLPDVTQQFTFVFSCEGFSCSPNPSTTLTINALAS